MRPFRLKQVIDYHRTIMVCNMQGDCGLTREMCISTEDYFTDVPERSWQVTRVTGYQEESSVCNLMHYDLNFLLSIMRCSIFHPLISASLILTMIQKPPNRRCKCTYCTIYCVERFIPFYINLKYMFLLKFTCLSICKLLMILILFLLNTLTFYIII